VSMIIIFDFDTGTCLAVLHTLHDMLAVVNSSTAGALHRLG